MRVKVPSCGDYEARYPSVALVILIALVAFAIGCGDKADPKEVLTPADVQEAFEHQGLDLAPYGMGPGIPATTRRGGSARFHWLPRRAAAA